MEVVTQNRLTRNAYRILGLGGDASQEAIDQAARKMRLWATAKRIPETNWDLPWLGTLERNKSDIEQAVARLADPPTRLRERLMWFCGAPEEFSGGDLHAVQENLLQTNGESSAQRDHNSAVAELAAAMFQPQPIHPGSWESVLNHFKQLSDSQEQLRWQIQLENDGGFEKRASEDEIADSQRAMPREIASSLGRHIESALEDDNVEEASSFLAILRSVGGKTDQRILDRLEEVFERRCHNIADDLRAGVRGDHPPQRNAATADSAQSGFENSIVPLRRDLEKLAEQQPERIKRIRWHCSRVLSMIGTAWVWSHEFVKAEEVLNQALSLAQSSAQEKEVRGQLAENENRAEQQRRRYTMVADRTTGYTISVSNAGEVAPAGAGTVQYTSKNGAPADASGKSKGQRTSFAAPGGFTIGRPVVSGPVAAPAQQKRYSGLFVLIAIAVAALRVATMVNHNDSRTPTYDPPRLRFPQPSYQPLPQPSYDLPPSWQPQSAYRPAPQGQSESVDDIIQRAFKSKDALKAPAPPTDREKQSWIYGPAPTATGVERRKPFEWTPLLPAPQQSAQDHSAAEKKATSVQPSKIYDGVNAYPAPPPQPAQNTSTPATSIPAKPDKSFPEAPSRPATASITAENAGLSSSPPPRYGQIYLTGLHDK